MGRMTYLRLDPAHPLLWRDERTLQLGAHAVVTVCDPQPWQERVLDALERGVDSDALARMTSALAVPPDEFAAFVSRLQPAVARPAPARAVQLRAADSVDAGTCLDVAEALGAAGVAACLSGPQQPFVRGEPVILLAQHHLPPHLPARVMSEDLPHLAVVFDAGGVTVGPVVEPGRTACLACLSAHERDRDAAWPAIVAQLVSRRPLAVPRARAMEAGMLVARLLRERGAGGDVSATSSVRSDASARRTWRSHRPHAECLCGAAAPVPDATRSRRGTETPPAPLSPHPTAAPTRSTAFARRA